MSSSWPGTLTGFNHCQRQRLSDSPTVSAVCRAADNATIVVDQFRAARIGSIMPTISSVTKQFLKPFCCQDSARRAPEVALIEMNEPRETGFERGVFD